MELNTDRGEMGIEMNSLSILKSGVSVAVLAAAVYFFARWLARSTLKQHPEYAETRVTKTGLVIAVLVTVITFYGLLYRAGHPDSDFAKFFSLHGARSFYGLLLLLTLWGISIFLRRFGVSLFEYKKDRVKQELPNPDNDMTAASKRRRVVAPLLALLLLLVYAVSNLVSPPRFQENEVLFQTINLIAGVVFLWFFIRHRQRYAYSWLWFVVWLTYMSWATYELIWLAITHG